MKRFIIVAIILVLAALAAFYVFHSKPKDISPDGFCDTIFYGTFRDVQASIKAGANVNGFDECDESPLMVATRNGNVEVIKTLIQSGADINGKNKAGNTPLYFAVDDFFYTDVSESDKESIAKLLIDTKADVNAANTNGETILIRAINTGQSTTNPAIVAELLRAGANIEQRDQYGETPLMAATAHDPTGVFTKLLIENRAQVNARTSTNSKWAKGYTPLMCAVASSDASPDVVTLLIKDGAEVNTVNDDGLTALDLAIFELNCEEKSVKKKQNVNLLRQAGAKTGNELKEKTQQPDKSKS